MSDQQLTVATEGKALDPSEMARAIMDMAQKMTPEHIGNLKALIEMQERLEQREAERKFVVAFNEMQKELPVFKRNGTLEYPKDKNNPDGPKRQISKFARYDDDISPVLDPILQAHDFTLTYDNELTSAGTLVVIAILRHIGGHVTRTRSPPLPCDSSGGKNNLQGWGSSSSYGKRYSAIPALNLKFEGVDDDGKRGGIQHLAEEQVTELVGLLKDTKTDEARFLQVMTADARSMEEIETKDYVRIKNALLTKKRQMEKGSSGGG